MEDTLVAIDGNWLKLTCDARLYFYVRVLNRWNSLPHCRPTVDVKVLNAFKNQLEKIRSKHMDFFMDN